MSKLQNNGRGLRCRRRLGIPRTLRRSLLPALAAAAVLVALALAALGGIIPQAVPGARAQEYHLPNARIAGIASPEDAGRQNLVYPGTNTHIRLAVYDADQNQITFEDDEPALFWQGADAAACAVIIDADCSGIPGRWGNRWRMLWLRIKDGAPAGNYRINLTTHARNADGSPEAAASLTFTVVGRPTDMSARILGGSFIPGDRLRGSATVYDSRGRLATFTRNLQTGNGEPRRCHGCTWQAADAATASALQVCHL